MDIGLIAVIGMTAAMGVLAYRAWGAKNPVVRWGGVAVAGLLALLFGLVSAVAIAGLVKFTTQHDNPVPNVAVAGTPEQIARGEKWVNICQGCHGEDLGGVDFSEGGPPFGTLYAANLTPTHLSQWSDGEIIRAIREGVSRDGRALIIMPSGTFKHMGDEDVQALVAYLRTVPAVEPDTPPTQLNLVGLILTNMIPVYTRQAPVGTVTAPPAGVTVEYGAYLTSWVGCTDCHGENFAGRRADPNGPPAGPNLTTVVPKWTEAEFVTFLRTGKLPSGSAIGAGMPWQEYNRLASDAELKAMYAYLSGLEPLEGPAP